MAGVESHFSCHGEISLYPGREINAAQVRDADVLLVRSVTKVDRHLLANSPVKFVGSATIGTDHVDLDYLAERGIKFAFAPGCNATAVVQYVIAVLCACVSHWRHKSVSIIGCGQVGGRVLGCLRALGMKCQVFDPFLSSQQVPELCDFKQALNADIICLHTPLTLGGAHPTFHMIGMPELAQIRPDATLINAGRGAVIDNRALEARLSIGAIPRVVLDVWEDEPAIRRQLLAKVLLGTPHIAGHSLEGKQRGTTMVLEAFEQWLGIGLAGEDRTRDERLETRDKTDLKASDTTRLEDLVLAVYDPRCDFSDLRSALSNHDVLAATAFDAVRNAYQLRREFNQYRVHGVSNQNLAEDLLALGFAVAG